jgi:hypothetical protein
MANANLTAMRLYKIIFYEPETGIFNRIRKNGVLENCCQHADVLANKKYTKIRIDGYDYMAHRLAWLYVYGSWPNQLIDHINGIKTDNRIANLRDVSNQLNQQNQKGPRADNKLGYMGVSFSKQNFKNPYRVDIRYGGRQHFLGRFPTPEEAHATYLNAKRKYHPANTI